MESPVNFELVREIAMSTQLSTQSVSPRANVFAKSRHDGSLGRRIIDMVLEWRRRMRSRQELAQLSELELKDLGFRDRVAAEIAKPFWRP